MAFYLKVFALLHKLVILMNVLITFAMSYGLYRFLSQDGMFDGWSWTHYLPAYVLLFIALPILMCISLFKSSRKFLKVIFLILNILASIILLAGLFVNSWVMSNPESPFSWRSYIKICLILATSFVVNAMTRFLLLIQSRNPQRP
jgi:peptidoglycan/LPS O-acetylase OafA/YrhL